MRVLAWACHYKSEQAAWKYMTVKHLRQNRDRTSDHISTQTDSASEKS